MFDFEEEERGKKSIYRKVESRIWADEKFVALSPMPPSGQGLWLFLLTGPMLTPIPGLFRAGRLAMAEDLGWSTHDFDKHFAEVEAQGMVLADFKAKLVWVPKAIEHNKPASPNVVRSWGSHWHNLPECVLKVRAYDALNQQVSAMSEAYARAFTETIRPPLIKASLTTKSGSPPRRDDLEGASSQEAELFPGSADSKQRMSAQRLKSTSKKLEQIPKSSPVWDAYRGAYVRRYNCEPIRNAKVNAGLCLFVDRVGADLAPEIAAFYVGLDTAWYVKRGHPIDALVSDFQAIHTQWATGRKITETGSRIADRTASNGDAIAEAQRLVERRHH